jgi:hypothetical protein
LLNKKSNKEINSMKRKLITMAVTAVAVCGLAGIAQAVPISGDITFAGGITLDTSSAGTATEVLSWTGTGGTGLPVVISGDGSFSGVVGNSATFASPWHFNSGPVASLWSVGGFTFDLTSSHIVFQGGSPAGVLVDGIGAVMGPAGLDPEAMTWSFSTSDPSAAGIFSFQVADGTTGSVPDGGTTAMLLGLGVLALGMLKKQLFV